MEPYIINMGKDVLWFSDNKIPLYVLSHAAPPAKRSPLSSVCFLDVLLCFLALARRLLFHPPPLNEIKIK